ncbi:putative solute carrier family 10 member 6 [Apostichopus japonicus]|uniref:Putative solute carrier family 10 member 6 n=1 Tax=Stichopus japonicus TaxID=307972 RepID=A0A2G8LIL8_STIJA|nr:putative solute carrier family 10 member 6 [Apostichopus japonicus]
MAMTTAAINLAIGSLMTRIEFKRQYKFPGCLAVGCLSQFILFPLVVFGLVQALKLEYAYAVGMLMTAVVPTSSVASLLTFFMDGNIYVSVAMTFISTIMSVGMIPALFFFLTEDVSMETVQTPAYALIIALLHMTIPLLIGIFCRKLLKPIWNKLLVMFGLSCGLLGFAGNIILQFSLNKALLNAPVNVFYALALLPVISFIMGYGMGCVGRQDEPARKAFGISLVYHNMAISLLSLSSSDVHDQKWTELTTFPSLYTPVTGIYGLVAVILYLVCFSVDHESGLRANHGIRSGYRIISDEDYPEPNSNVVSAKDYKKIKEEDLNNLGLVGRGGEIMRIDSITMPTVAEEYTS